MKKPLEFEETRKVFFRWLTVTNYALQSQISFRTVLKPFGLFLQEKGIVDLRLVTPDVIQAYLEAMQTKPWCKRTRQIYLERLRVFFAWLTRHQMILLNPTENFKIGFRDNKVPQVLSTREMQKLLSVVPPGTGRVELRERAILELFYSTGIRLTELIQLKAEDLSQGLLRITEGKGARERVVPVGREAIFWVRRYLIELRPCLVRREAPQAHLFLSQGGQPLSPPLIRQHFQRRAKAAGLGRRFYPHLLRHTMASHLVARGASLRVVQEILGHRVLESTQIYTHTSNVDLKKCHRKYHPRGRWLWKSKNSSAVSLPGERWPV